jgi:hypothetical protein
LLNQGLFLLVSKRCNAPSRPVHWLQMNLPTAAS